jgi:hypothetical protein
VRKSNKAPVCWVCNRPLSHLFRSPRRQAGTLDAGRLGRPVGGPVAAADRSVAPRGDGLHGQDQDGPALGLCPRRAPAGSGLPVLARPPDQRRPLRQDKAGPLIDGLWARLAANQTEALGQIRTRRRHALRPRALARPAVLHQRWQAGDRQQCRRAHLARRRPGPQKLSFRRLRSSRRPTAAYSLIETEPRRSPDAYFLPNGGAAPTNGLNIRRPRTGGCSMRGLAPGPSLGKWVAGGSPMRTNRSRHPHWYIWIPLTCVACRHVLPLKGDGTKAAAPPPVAGRHQQPATVPKHVEIITSSRIGRRRRRR